MFCAPTGILELTQPLLNPGGLQQGPTWVDLGALGPDDHRSRCGGCSPGPQGRSERCLGQEELLGSPSASSLRAALVTAYGTLV